MLDHLTVKVRRRQPSDLARCIKTLERVHREFAYPAQWPKDPASWIANATEREAWVVDADDGSIAGHVDRRETTDHPVTPLWCERAGRDETELVVISRLFIAPDQVGQGIGTALLATAVERSHELGLQPVLSVLADHHEAIAFYEKRGWESAGVTNDTWAELEDPIKVMAMIGPYNLAGNV